MFIKRSDPTPGKAPCQSCSRIRAFLAIAGLLIIALPLIGDAASPISNLTPMSFALGLVAIGFVGFVVRWIAWRHSRKQDHQHSSHSVQTKKGQKKDTEA
jgi:hypothetical protein